jgi:hypothetical protein
LGRIERAHATTTETEGEGRSQPNGNKQTNSSAPESPPAYDPNSLISHIKTLSIGECDELLDKLMEGEAGF